MPFRLIQDHEAEFVRRPGAFCNIEGVGVVERVVATGRARCRQCGEKIAKGLNVIRFYHDFTGCGSWTSVEVQIHAQPCKKEEN